MRSGAIVSVTSTPVTTTVQNATTTSSTPANPNTLTVEQMLNEKYVIYELQQTAIILQNGLAQKTVYGDEEETFSVFNDKGQPLISIGDFNGDGKKDAAVLLRSKQVDPALPLSPYVSTYLEVFLNQQGMPALTYVVGAPERSPTNDDEEQGSSVPRTEIFGIAIKKNSVDLTTASGTIEYVLKDNALVRLDPTFSLGDTAIPSTWKTYVDKHLGFSLQYPSDLTPKPSPDGVTFAQNGSVDETSPRILMASSTECGVEPTANTPLFELPLHPVTLFTTDPEGYFEGAAGTFYVTHAFSTEKKSNGTCFVLQNTDSAVDCGNYGDPADIKTCEQQEKNFGELQGSAWAKMVSSFRITTQ